MTGNPAIEKKVTQTLEIQGKAVSAQNVIDTFKYDPFGNPTESKIVNPSNSADYIASAAGYTSDGNYMSWMKDPLGNQISYTYDTARGLLQKTQDGMQYATEYDYDALDRLKTVSKACSGGFADGTAQVDYTYENDSLKQITHNGYSYTFTEDGFGNSTEVSAAGRKLARRVYEANNGNLLFEQYNNGCTHRYFFDERDRLKEIRLKDTAGTQYVLYRYDYDKEGNIAVEYDIREDLGQETIVNRYFYDLSGRMVYMRNDQGEGYRFTYDLNDNLVKIVQENRFRKVQTSYTYDKDNRESSAKTAGRTNTTAYDALGRVTSRTWNTATPHVTQYTYQAGANGSRRSASARLKSRKNHS